MKIKQIIAVAVSASMLLSLSAVPALGDEIPEGFSSMEEYYNYLLFGTKGDNTTPELDEMRLIGENDRVKMYYNESGADVFIEEKASGKVYGSEVDSEYIDTKEMSPSSVSNLVTVNYADESGDLREADFTSASAEGFSSSTEYSDNSVSVSITLIDASISFNLILSITDDGFEANIPYESIKEEGKCRLVSLRLMPAFGAAKPGENGYIFYPDGSGAVMEFADYRKTQPEFYNYSYYCNNKLTFDVYEENENLDIKSMMLPVFGIKHTSGGVFAEITGGDTDAGLHISADALYQSYFELYYRTYSTVTYNFSSKSKGEVNKLSEELTEGDRTVRYHILPDGKNTYSDMAVLYRNELISRGELKAQDKNSGVPLSVEFFMGIRKNGIIGDSIQCLTAFDDAEKIINDLAENGVENADFSLKGWCKGGYDTLPTCVSAESKLGGNSSLNALCKTADGLGFKIYLLADMINANSDTGSFNAQKNALRDALNTTLTDEGGTKYWLNPAIYLPDAAQKLVNSRNNGSAVCFENLGEWLLSDVGKSHATSRKDMADTIRNVLEDAKEQNGYVAVTGGNKYVCGAADRLYEIPDSDSQYYQTNLTVPFWQMVMHGFADYSSLAANLSYDFNYQKLKFVETGSIPHFVITENSPNLLQGTSYDGIFTSEYSVMKDTVIEIYREMNERLSGVWNLTLDKHEYLSDKLVRVTYSDGSAVYINYGADAVEINGVNIPSMDYVLVKGA